MSAVNLMNRLDLRRGFGREGLNEGWLALFAGRSGGWQLGSDDCSHAHYSFCLLHMSCEKYHWTNPAACLSKKIFQRCLVQW